MVREIIVPADPNITLHLPNEMVGKTVEVIAFEISDTITTLTKEQRLTQIEELTKNSLVDLSAFKFNRDKANDYEE